MPRSARSFIQSARQILATLPYGTNEFSLLAVVLATYETSDSESSSVSITEMQVFFRFWMAREPI